MQASFFTHWASAGHVFEKRVLPSVCVRFDEHVANGWLGAVHFPATELFMNQPLHDGDFRVVCMDGSILSGWSWVEGFSDFGFSDPRVLAIPLTPSATLVNEVVDTNLHDSSAVFLTGNDKAKMMKLLHVWSMQAMCMSLVLITCLVLRTVGVHWTVIIVSHAFGTVLVTLPANLGPVPSWCLWMS